MSIFSPQTGKKIFTTYIFDKGQIQNKMLTNQLKSQQSNLKMNKRLDQTLGQTEELVKMNNKHTVERCFMSQKYKLKHIYYNN